MGHTSSEFAEESSPSKIYEAIRHDSPGSTLERYSLHKPVRLLRNGEQGYVKCPHERGWPLAFANCVKLRIRGNAWKWAGVVGDSPWLIRELEDESSLSAKKAHDRQAVGFFGGRTSGGRPSGFGEGAPIARARTTPQAAIPLPPPIFPSESRILGDQNWRSSQLENVSRS